MNSKLTSTTLFLFFVTTAVLVLAENTWAAKDGKGKPGGDPELPNVRYEVERIPLPEDHQGLWINGINNSGTVIGYYRLNGKHWGFLYNQSTKEFHDLNLLAPLFHVPSGPVDWWIDWHVRSAVGINDSGDVVGAVTDETGTITGFLLETDLSANPEDWTSPTDWTFQFLPDLGSDFSYGSDVNLYGEVLGVYRWPDGTYERYLYNPGVDGPAGNEPFWLGLELISGRMNKHGQIAGLLVGDRAFFDPDPRSEPSSRQEFDDVRYWEVRGLNDIGVFCGTARMRLDGRGPSQSVAFRYTDKLEPIMAGLATGINIENDVLVYNDSGSYLVQQGVEPDQYQIWNISDLISDTDPLKAFWYRMMRITNRWPTAGFGQLVGYSSETLPDGATRSVGVVLTPKRP